MTTIFIFITAALSVIGLITLSNVLFFPRLRAADEQRDEHDVPFVSVLIPARDEAPVIGQTITRLMSQDYANYEIILLDDGSTDGTADLARQAACGDARLLIIEGAPLPEGWVGKNWACHQMSQHASGDYFIFTDADVSWNENALNTLMREMIQTGADLYTVWPTQYTETWPERLCVPLMAMVVVGYLPVIGTHHVPLSVFGAANGQCMAWNRAAYERIGGHEIVKSNVLEDVTLARMVKAHGLKLRMADGGGLIACRMYENWPDVRDGFAKNILQGYGGSVIALLLATAFHLLLFIVPWAWLLLGPLIEWPGWPEWPLSLVLIGLTVRALTAGFTGQRVHDSLLMPLSVLLMTRIAIQAIWWRYHYGGPLWKGRVATGAIARQEVTHD